MQVVTIISIMTTIISHTPNPKIDATPQLRQP